MVFNKSTDSGNLPKSLDLRFEHSGFLDTIVFILFLIPKPPKPFIFLYLFYTFSKPFDRLDRFASKSIEKLRKSIKWCYKY